jgi:hypothetical protein
MSTTGQAPSVSRWRKKPVEIEARLFDPGTDYDEACSVVAWCSGTATDDGCEIGTLEGVMLASPGDWIIRGVQGEFYPCKPSVFAATYEPAGEMLVLPPGGITAYRARAEAAEAKMAAIAAYCLGRGITHSDAGTVQTIEGVIAIIGSEGTAPLRTSDQWAVAWGSDDLNDGIGRVDFYDDEEDAREHVGFYEGGSVVRRTVVSLPWEAVPAGDPR